MTLRETNCVTSSPAGSCSLYVCLTIAQCHKLNISLQCIGSCSLYGVCLTSVISSNHNTAPTISLATTSAAPMTTSIKYGYTYTACASDQQPAPGAECELGAAAKDAQTGDLTSAVLVCAPSTCSTAACIASKLYHLRLSSSFICLSQACACARLGAVRQ